MNAHLIDHGQSALGGRRQIIELARSPMPHSIPLDFPSLRPVHYMRKGHLEAPAEGRLLKESHYHSLHQFLEITLFGLLPMPHRR